MSSDVYPNTESRPTLGHVKFRVSKDAQRRALLAGQTLASEWTVRVCTKESAKLALELGAEITSDGAVQLDALRHTLDDLPKDTTEAFQALQAIQAKKQEKEKTQR